MSERLDVRVVFPIELSERLRRYADTTYGGQKGSITLTITQATKEFLDRHEDTQNSIPKGQRVRAQMERK